MEILAPVGNLENLRLAIAHGANAVYFGVSKFNARAKCQEIDLQNLRECVRYAHLFNVKVYLTLNTLIKNEEVESLIETVSCAINAKVDAFIIQDMGVYNILTTHFSNLNLHASTQMGIHNLSGAKVAEKLGFSRIVLSRETSLQDIKEIKNNTNLEIEYFVQGALCVAFSGNCYLSSLEKGASGNRGECLQLCRLKYKAEQNEKTVSEGYLLSPSDICLIRYLKELKKAGVCSLKIEGRMRRGAYVSRCVESYLKALANNNVNIEDEIYKLKKVFSRGDFNEGKYLNLNKDIIQKKFQNHIGVEIGKVVNVSPFKDLNKIIIQTNGYEISQKDGLKFLFNDKQIGIGVGSVKKENGNYAVFSVAKPNIGSKVNLTLDFNEEEKLCKKQRKIKVDCFVKAIENKRLEIEMKTENSRVKVFGDIVESATKNPLSEMEIKNSICKLGDTNFEIENIKVLSENPFIAKSVLNFQRRKAVELLEEEIIKNSEKGLNYLKIDTKNIKNEGFFQKNNQKTFNYYVFDELNQINNFKDKNNIFIFAPKIYESKHIKNVLSKCEKEKEIYLNLPIIANFKDENIIDEILKENSERLKGVFINNIWGLKYLGEFNVVASHNLNITNDLSRQVYEKLGVCDFVISIENNLVSNMKSYVAYFGKPTLMTLAHCPQKTCLQKPCTKQCNYEELSYTMENGKKYTIRKYKISTCYFELIGSEIKKKNGSRFCEDLRK